MAGWSSGTGRVTLHVENAPYEFVGFGDAINLRARARVGQDLTIDAVLALCSAFEEQTWTWSQLRASVTDLRGRRSVLGGAATLLPGAQGDAGAPTPAPGPRTQELVWPGSVGASGNEYALVQTKLRFTRPGTYAFRFKTPWSDSSFDPAGPQPGSDDPNSEDAVLQITVSGREPPATGRGASATVKTCWSTQAPQMSRQPSRRVARPGRPRVKLHKRRRVCTHQRYRGERAQWWRAQPETPIEGPFDIPPPPIGDCLLSGDAESLALNGFLLSRRDWCAPPAPISVTAWLETKGGEVLIGTGGLLLERRIRWGPSTSAGRYTTTATYVGVSGVLLPGAFFRFNVRCEMAFDTKCAGVSDGSPIRVSEPVRPRP